MDFDPDALDDARRYYANIVGKYGAQVQALLKKEAALDIPMICPLHGPMCGKNMKSMIEELKNCAVPEPMSALNLRQKRLAWKI